MTKPCIQINNLSKRYSGSLSHSLSDVSFTINKQDKFGIIGPNGAGKTTLISIICGVIEATIGDVSYFIKEKNINLPAFKRVTGYVPQEYAFYHDLSPNQNLEYFGAFYNLSKDEIHQNSQDILSRLGLSDVADKKISTFSGGMKRRVNLAIGIIHNPDFLFLDEPTVGVDVQSKNAILKFLTDLNNQGTTIIYTSHIMSEAESFCNNIALIDNGKLVAQDNIYNLLKVHDERDLESLFINLTGEEYRDV